MLADNRILIADDHGIVRMGMMQVINQLMPTALLWEADDYKSVYSIITKEKFDLVILDVNMPNGSLQEAIDFIKIKQPALKILVFSSQDEHVYAVRYLKMGADGFLNKLSSKELIHRALNAMLNKGRFISDEVKEAMVFDSLNKHRKTSPMESLSNRELQVANKLCEGLSLKEMSHRLNLHSSTISTYKNRIFEKLDIQSIPELVDILRIYN